MSIFHLYFPKKLCIFLRAMSEPSLRVRVEEVLIGALSGALVGLTVASPLAIGVNLYSLYSLPDLLHEPRVLFVYFLMLLGAIAGIRLASRQQDFEHLRGARFISDPTRATAELRKRERTALSVSQQGGRFRG
ncbi:hypothetical protein EM20IM_06320 [Candidatus Methylacidiphilum infernorum]|uniref:Chloride channel protein EriC n=1 Tax=Candidatus Methylacidiphilum infernorum TaxID=511746 RepID=A0ABX7PTX9_9BACT|nr:hypothetical protein [Candidatus Methylacidiphilum infernorum]QSR86123.1 hypothetical protein EM20IM_06320 [Candidatus Methylacidiphilum infernorum]